MQVVPATCFCIKGEQAIKNLKISKSTGIDQIDNYCVKVAADVIAEPLHHIITLSIYQQKFPTSWKNSKVIPLHKKESKLETKNYRPVSILSPFSKILKKIIMSRSINTSLGTEYFILIYMDIGTIDPLKQL